MNHEARRKAQPAGSPPGLPPRGYEPTSTISHPDVPGFSQLQAFKPASSSPIPQQLQQVGHVDRAVIVHIREGSGLAPLAQQHQQVADIDPAIGVDVAEGGIQGHEDSRDVRIDRHLPPVVDGGDVADKQARGRDEVIQDERLAVLPEVGEVPEINTYESLR